MTHRKVVFITQAGVIAAVYIVITVLVGAFNLASGSIQVRLSEALCILPVFTPAAIPGLVIGCFLGNVLTGCVVWDILLGTLATLLGALGTYYLRKQKYVYTLPPIISNALIVPFVLKFAYNMPGPWWLFSVTVGAGEFIAVGIFGFILKKALDKVPKNF